MKDIGDYRTARLDEIMNSTELLDFNYKVRRSMSPLLRLAAILIVSVAIFTVLPLLPGTGKGYTAHGASVTASGRTTDAVNVRKSPTVNSASLGVLKNGTALTISKEVFTSATSTGSTTRWYAVKGGGKSGYIRADLVKITKYANVIATTTDALNYRTGAGTSMKRVGTLGFGERVTVCLPASAKGSSATWYRIKRGSGYYYVSGSYLNFNNVSPLANLKKNSTITSKLRAGSTNGGSARYVYTLDETNCSKKFKVYGYANGWVPQGMSYTGSSYHIVFGMGGGQSIVTYSDKGRRLAATRYGYNMGKPNSMTYNPSTKLCYIFRGSQRKIHIWNPKNNRFSSASVPYSSSGIAYDSNTRKMYATSLTGVRVYSGDGSFKHEKLFNRCSHKGLTYVQDCGAYGGIVIHAISGAYKFGANYLDFYNAKSGKYLGSVKVYLGELESVVVNKDGFVELLVNHGGTYDEYIWKTPINVKDLMK